MSDDMLAAKSDIDPNLSWRWATPDDAAQVVAYMHKLGAYQKMSDAIIATPASIRGLLEKGQGEAIFCLYDGAPIGFAYFCEKSSAFTGRSGIFIDGFLIDEQMRHKHAGRFVMSALCQIALGRGCQLLEWGCLDWNAPAITFYQGLGAYCLDDMRIYRLTPDQMHTVAEMTPYSGSS